MDILHLSKRKPSNWELRGLAALRPPLYHAGGTLPSPRARRGKEQARLAWFKYHKLQL